MKKAPSLNELEERKQTLLKSLRLPDLLAAGAEPAVLANADAKYLYDLVERIDLPWGEEGSCPELSQYINDVIKKTDDGSALYVQSDVDFLEKVSKGEDVIHRGPFGTIEAAFPVRLRGKTIHCFWSGPLKDKPFEIVDIAEIAKATQRSEEQVTKQLDKIVVLSDSLCDQLLDNCRKIRDCFKQAVIQHLQVHELTNQLVASERTHSLGTLSGGVAHHFNNLLSVILGYASYVHNREELSDEADDALLKITEAAQKGRRLTEEILAFTGSDTGEDEPCNLNDTVTSVLSLLQSQATSRVQVSSKLNASQDTVVAPPGAIRQVVFSLLSNAMESMPASGTLEVLSSNMNLCDNGKDQNFIRLNVKDSSGRLPEGVQQAVEEGMPEVDDDLTERTGLKFSSLYGMVGRLDGTITVSSEPGEHTHVEVLLPVSVEGTSGNQELKAKQKLAPSEIWVIDDDPIFREMCNQVLSDEGHTINALSGGNELMELWASGQKKPELLIIDFSMPEYNGLELCEWLREQGAKMPVILVSGFAGSQRDIKKALQLKKTYFLQKPFTFREMADTVTVALGETLISE